MTLVLKIAFRNLMRQKRRSLLSSLTLIFGFILLSLSMGLAKGSYQSVIDSFTKERTGHVQIHALDYRMRPSLHKNFGKDTLEKLKEKDSILSWSPRVYSPVLAFGNHKTFGAQLIGIDLEKEALNTNLKKKIIQGRFSREGILMPQDFAEKLKVHIGDQVALITQAADGSIANELFTLVGILRSFSSLPSEQLIYLDIQKAQSFLSLYHRYHQVALLTHSSQRAPSFAKDLSQGLKDPQLEILPWQEIEKVFYQAMLADIKGMWISLFVILLIVCIGILNALFVSIMERSKEYGILKALGTSSKQLLIFITLEVQILTLFSIAFASLISFLIHHYLSKYGIELPEPIDFAGFSFSSYKSTQEAQIYFVPALLLIACSFFVTLGPTWGLIVKKPIELLHRPNR